jgi:hypothetical protein
MDARQLSILALAMCVIGLLLASVTGVFVFAEIALALGAAVIGIAVVSSSLRKRLISRFDKYDLASLRQIDEQMKLSELEPGTVSGDADEIVCLRCGRAYNARIPVCPACRHCP